MNKTLVQLAPTDHRSRPRNVLKKSCTISSFLLTTVFVLLIIKTSNYIACNDSTQYLINTPQCTIAAVPVFTNETIPLYRMFNPKEYPCRHDNDTVADIRRVYYTWVQVPDGVFCTAVEIERDESTDGSKYGNSFEFDGQPVMEFPNSDAVEVTCGEERRIIPLIPEKTPLWSNDSQGARSAVARNRPNILAIGIDSISRLNFLRHLTETNQFLMSANFSGPLFGHHKVGENTWPNLNAMLTGLNTSTIDRILPECRHLDNLPLIFKAFSAAGYLTTFIENMPKYGLFNYHGKAGFTKQPVDYLMRPVNIQVYKELQQSFCYKEKLELELYYDYLLDQMRAFDERNQRFFTLIHTGAITHDIFNNAQYADLPIKRLLSAIFTENLNENTVIIFFSDHGIRFGEILQTLSGYHESRMPFMFFYIPETLKLKDSTGKWMNFKQIRAIFEANTRKLTSQYDVHATFRHILEETPPDDEQYGRSLFSDIPLNRTCEEAGIPTEYCLCRIQTPFNNGPSLALLGKATVDYINERLILYARLCVMLDLESVQKGRMSSGDPGNSSKGTFVVAVHTLPNNGIYEATLQAELSNGTIDETKEIQIIGNILRLDGYLKQSKCAENTPVESYCFCRDLI